MQWVGVLIIIKIIAKTDLVKKKISSQNIYYTTYFRIIITNIIFAYNSSSWVSFLCMNIEYSYTFEKVKCFKLKKYIKILLIVFNALNF